MKCQRRQYKLYKSKQQYYSITPERIDRLESIGFKWELLGGNKEQQQQQQSKKATSSAVIWKLPVRPIQEGLDLVI